MYLVIGNKNWSSWSMRPWLVAKRAGFAFDEVMVALRQGDKTAAQIAAHSPSGKVPVLIDGDLTVWDSLAICEYLADLKPQARLWPADQTTRALARSASAEMYSGFSTLRQECPMDLALRVEAELTEDVAKDVRRIVELWCDLRGRFAAQGPFLTGAWSIADAFFTPVATRFRTYGVDLAAYGDTGGAAAAYRDILLSQPEYLEWEKAALAEG